MSEQQAAATAVDPLENLTDEQFRQYRSTGQLPAEPAEAAPADDQEQTDSEAQTESAGESETPKPEVIQEHKPKNAAQRIAKLEAAIEAEWGKDEPDVVRIGQLNATIDKINGRPKRKSEAAPPQAVESKPNQQPQKPAQNLAEWASQFDVDKWEEDYIKAHPGATYARMELDKAIYIKGAEKHFEAIEQQRLSAQRALEDIVSKAREKYPDFVEVVDPAAMTILQTEGMPEIVLQRIRKSPVRDDVVYALGVDPDAMHDFLQISVKDPLDAIDYIANLERGIKEHFEKQTGNAGQTGNAPERKRTQAPPPPTPVGGSSARSFDVNDESLSEDEWMRKRRAQLGTK